MRCGLLLEKSLRCGDASSDACDALETAWHFCCDLGSAMRSCDAHRAICDARCGTAKSARENKLARAFGPTPPCHVDARGCHFRTSPPLIENWDFKCGPLSAQECTQQELTTSSIRTKCNLGHLSDDSAGANEHQLPDTWKDTGTDLTM